jgi:hypothetical protein
MLKHFGTMICAVFTTALLVLTSPAALADEADEMAEEMRGEESYRSFPQLMMRQKSNFDLPDHIAQKFEKDLQAALGLWRYTIVDHGPDGPEILDWCNKITSDLQTYRQETDAETNEADLTLESKEFQCSEAYSYILNVTHTCRTTGTAGDATQTRRAICAVDAEIGFGKYQARFNAKAEVAGGNAASASLTGDDTPTVERGRMVWSPQTDWGNKGTIKIHARDEQRMVIKPGEEDKALDEALEWALVTVLSKASGLLNEEQDLKPKGMVQNAKGSDVELCLSKDIVKLDAPFALYDDKGERAGYMKARDLHDGCMLTPSIERRVRDKRARRIKTRTRLELDPLGKKGKSIDADVDDEDWDQGAMIGQLITGDAMDRFGMGYLAQELPYSGWTFGLYGGMIMGLDNGASIGPGGGLGMEYSLASALDISEFHVYGQLGVAAFSGDMDLNLEAGVLKRWYVAGPFFIDAGAGIAAGYGLGSESVFAGAAANLGLGLTFSPGFGMRLKAGYRAGAAIGVGADGGVGFGHGVLASLNFNITM